VSGTRDFADAEFFSCLRCVRESCDWATAYDALGPDDLDALGETAHWLGRPDETVDAYIKAHDLHVAEGSTGKAARSAFMLAVYLRVAGLLGSDLDAATVQARRHLLRAHLRVS
jgi:hypothetical protein